MVAPQDLLPGGKLRNAFHDWAIDEETACRTYLFDLVRTFSPAGMFDQDSDGNTPFHLAIGSRNFVKAVQMAEMIMATNFGEKGLQEIVGLSNRRGETALQQGLHALYYSLEYVDDEAVVEPLIQFIQLTSPLADLDKTSEQGYCYVAPEFLASPREFFNSYLAHRAQCATLYPLFFRPQISSPAATSPTTSTASPVEGPSPVLPEVQPATPRAALGGAVAPEDQASPVPADVSLKKSKQPKKLEVSSPPAPASLVAKVVRPAAVPVTFPKSYAAAVGTGGSPSEKKPESRPALPQPAPARQLHVAALPAVQEPASSTSVLPVKDFVLLSPPVGVREPGAAVAEKGGVSKKKTEAQDADSKDAREEVVAKPSHAAGSAAAACSPEDELFNILENKNLPALKRWLQVKAHKTLLCGKGPWNRDGHTPLYKALITGFYSGAVALVQAAPQQLLLKENKNAEGCPLEWMLGYADADDVKLLFQQSYAEEEFNPAKPMRKGGKPIEQLAREVGLLETSLQKPTVVVDAKPSKRQVKQKVAAKKNEKELRLVAANLAASYNRATQGASEVHNALRRDVVNFLQKNDARVRDYELCINNTAGKILLALEGYSAALFVAFLYGSRSCFTFLLSKIEDINLPVCLPVGEALLHALSDGNLLANIYRFFVSAAPVFEFDEVHFEMIQEYCNHSSFNPNQPYRFDLKSGRQVEWTTTIRVFERLARTVPSPFIKKIMMVFWRAGGDIFGTLQAMRKVGTDFPDFGAASVALLTHILLECIKENADTFLQRYNTSPIIPLLAYYGQWECLDALYEAGKFEGNEGRRLLTASRPLNIDRGILFPHNALSMALQVWRDNKTEQQDEMAAEARMLVKKLLCWASVEEWLATLPLHRQQVIAEEVVSCLSTPAEEEWTEADEAIISAVRQDNVDSLRDHDELMQNYRLTIVKQGKKILQLKGYDVGLLLAFLVGAERSFEYLLSKIENINRPREYIGGGLLIHILLDPQIRSCIATKIPGISPFAEKQVDMLALFLAHKEFNPKQYCVFSINGAKSEVATLTGALLLLANKIPEPLMLKIVALLFEAGAPLLEPIDWAIGQCVAFLPEATKYIDPMLAAKIKEDPTTFALTFQSPLGFWSARYFLFECMEALHAAGKFDGEEGMRLLTEPVVQRSGVLDNALSTLTHWVEAAQDVAGEDFEFKERLVRAFNALLLWVPLEPWLEPLPPAMHEEIKAVAARCLEAEAIAPSLM